MTTIELTTLKPHDAIIFEITIFLIWSPICPRVSIAKDSDSDIRFRALYKLRDKKTTVRLSGSDDISIAVTNFLTVDLGVLYYINEAIFTLESKGGIRLEILYHRTIYSPGVKREDMVKEVNRYNFPIYALCRKLKLSGFYTLRNVKLHGYNTFFDENLGCYNEELKFILDSKTAPTALESCIRNCRKDGFKTAFFSGYESQRCKCAEPDDAAVDSNKMCDATCKEKEHQVCGGAKHYSAYATKDRSVFNDSLWECIHDSEQCEKCDDDEIACGREDRDECLIPDTCDEHTCKNLPGTYICHCNKGFTLDALTWKCIESEECEDDALICVNGVCKRKKGKNICVCNTGYFLDKEECVDIDECETECKVEHMICNNVPGSFECLCSKGFKIIEDKCEESEECEDDVLICVNGVCKYKKGTPICVCYTGYLLDKDQCVDIDECETECKVENMSCSNVPGSFECFCSKGFKIIEDKCEDVDECLSVVNECGEESCTNTVGSYFCVCPRGETLVRDDVFFTCEDLDECLENNECLDQPSICINTPGTYICLCLEGYINIDPMNCYLAPSGTNIHEYTDNISTESQSTGGPFVDVLFFYFLIVVSIAAIVVMVSLCIKRRLLGRGRSKSSSKSKSSSFSSI